MTGCNKSFHSLVFVLTQLHVGQWSSLPFCLPSLIAQWSIRIFHFYPLYVIVKLAFYVTENYSKYVINFCLSLDFCLKTYDYMWLLNSLWDPSHVCSHCYHCFGCHEKWCKKKKYFSEVICTCSYSSCVYLMMMFKGSNGKVCKMMTSHFRTLMALAGCAKSKKWTI